MSEYFISFNRNNNESSRRSMPFSSKTVDEEEKEEIKASIPPSNFSYYNSSNVYGDTNCFKSESSVCGTNNFNKDKDQSGTDVNSTNYNYNDTSTTYTTRTSRSQFNDIEEKKESIADFENISIEGDDSYCYSTYPSCVSEEISDIEEDETITKNFHKDINAELQHHDKLEEDYRRSCRTSVDKKYFYSCRHINNKDANDINEMIKKRRCTNVFCFIILATFWMGKYCCYYIYSIKLR